MANSAPIRRFLRDFKKQPVPYNVACVTERSANQAVLEIRRQMKRDLDQPRQKTLRAVRTYRTGPNSHRVYVTGARGRSKVSPAEYIEPLIRGGTIKANRNNHRRIAVPLGQFRRANGNARPEVSRALKAIAAGTARGDIRVSGLTRGFYYLSKPNGQGWTIFRRKKGSQKLEAMAHLPYRATYHRNTLNWNAALERVNRRQTTFVRQCRRKARLYR